MALKNKEYIRKINKEKEMKKKFLQIVSQVSVLLILIFLTCCDHHPTTPELALAEQLMEQKPDSALKVIQQIKNPEGLSSREHALYCLFLTLANDKNYITHTSDSVIKIAVNYFDKQNDQKYKMLAYYCMGRVNTDLQDALQAQEYYLKALESGENSKNYPLLLKVNSNLATLYSYQDIYEKSLPLYKKAIYYATKELPKDSTNISYVLRNIARTFSQMQQIDSAIYYNQQAIQYSKPYPRISILTDLGNLHFNKGDYIECKKCLDQAMSLIQNGKSLYPIYLSKGKLYMINNQLDSARFYLELSSKSRNIYTKAASLRRLAQLADKEKKYKDYISYTEQYEILRDSISTTSHSENIRIAQSMFNYQRVAKEKSKYEKKASDRMLLIYQIIIISSIILIVGFILYKRNDKKKEQLIKNNALKYKRSQQYIEDNKQEIARLENELSLEQIQKDKYQKQLYEARKTMLELENLYLFKRQGAIQILEKDLQNINLYVRIQQEDDIQLSACEWIEIQQLIDAIYPNFTERLGKVYNKISNEEIRICYLVKIKIPVKKIASIMHISPSGVSQCRRRLYKKFTGEAENAECFDKFIADF